MLDSASSRGCKPITVCGVHRICDAGRGRVKQRGAVQAVRSLGAGGMATITCNFLFIRTSFLAVLTTILFSRRHDTDAGDVGALLGFTCHDQLSFGFLRTHGILTGVITAGNRMRAEVVDQFEETAQTRSHPEGLLVPKDLARVATVAGSVHRPSPQDASQAQHDAWQKVEEIQTDQLPTRPRDCTFRGG